MITSGICASVRYAGTMEAYLLDWANLLIRWLHLTAGIAWVGTSFYYIPLDYHLLPPKDPRAIDEGGGGQALEIHGGRVYRVEKYRVWPPTLRHPLPPFQVERCTTSLYG